MVAHYVRRKNQQLLIKSRYCKPCFCVTILKYATSIYRFSGKEQLRCNCGATNCRGYVNAP